MAIVRTETPEETPTPIVDLQNELTALRAARASLTEKHNAVADARAALAAAEQAVEQGTREASDLQVSVDQKFDAVKQSAHEGTHWNPAVPTE